MSWMVAGTMAAVGALQANQQEKAARKQNQARANAAAAQTENSPWTGMGAGDPGQLANAGGGALMGAAQGGLSGYLTAKSNPDLFGGKKEVPNVNPNSSTPITDKMSFVDPSMEEMQKKYMTPMPRR